MRLLIISTLTAALCSVGIAAQAASARTCDGTSLSQTFRSKGDVMDLRDRYGPGAVFTISVENPGTFSSLSITGVCSSAAECNGKQVSFTSAIDRYIVSGIGDGLNSRVTATCSTGPNQAELDAERDAIVAVGGASGNHIGAALGNAMGARKSGSAPVLSTSGVFLTTLSTQGVASALGQPTGALWMALQGTQFGGTLDGSGGEFSIGGDVAITENAFLGAVLSYGTYDVTSGGINYETNSLSFGPYLSAQIGSRYSIDAYAVLANPNYTAAGTSYTSRRTSAGLKASAEYDLWGFATTSHLGVRGFREILPAAAVGGAREITSTTASLGMRVDFAPGAMARPYASLAVESTSFKDGAIRTDSVSPRVGFGVDLNGKLGAFSLNVDAGEVFDNADAVTFGFSWKLDI